MKLLALALQTRQWELAAHALVLAVVQAQVKEVQNGNKTRSPVRRQKRS